MLGALGTLAFLTTLWLIVVLGARILEESGARIAAALKGKPLRNPSLQITAARVRAPPRLRQPMRAAARLRAAA